MLVALAADRALKQCFCLRSSNKQGAKITAVQQAKEIGKEWSKAQL